MIDDTPWNTNGLLFLPVVNDDAQGYELNRGSSGSAPLFTFILVWRFRRQSAGGVNVNALFGKRMGN